MPAPIVLPTPKHVRLNMPSVRGNGDDAGSRTSISMGWRANSRLRKLIWVSTRPGRAPVALPSLQTSSPFTNTFSMPSGNTVGSANVARSMTVLRIEQHEVRVRTVAKDATIFPSQTLRRQRGHLANGLGQRQPPFLTHEPAEDARERAGAARMNRTDRSRRSQP